MRWPVATHARCLRNTQRVCLITALAGFRHTRFTFSAVPVVNACKNRAKKRRLASYLCGGGEGLVANAPIIHIRLTPQVQPPFTRAFSPVATDAFYIVAPVFRVVGKESIVS